MALYLLRAEIGVAVVRARTGHIACGIAGFPPEGVGTEVERLHEDGVDAVLLSTVEDVPEDEPKDGEVETTSLGDTDRSFIEPATGRTRRAPRT